MEKLSADEIIDDLEYKELKLIQDNKYFKFGIDAILLIDFAKNIKNDAIVMDIGTGTGIIPILLSNKTNLEKIYGVELLEKISKIAIRNVELNKLDKKVEIINDNINNIEKYILRNSLDVIITNPPYKKKNSGIINAIDEKTIARHEIYCEFQDICEKSSELLKNGGELYLIHRPERLVDIIYNLRKYKLEPKILKNIQSYSDSKPTMVLIKAVKNGNSFLTVEEPLIIYEKNGNYTDKIKEIYGKK